MTLTVSQLVSDITRLEKEKLKLNIEHSNEIQGLSKSISDLNILVEDKNTAIDMLKY